MSTTKMTMNVCIALMWNSYVPIMLKEISGSKFAFCCAYIIKKGADRRCVGEIRQQNVKQLSEPSRNRRQENEELSRNSHRRYQFRSQPSSSQFYSDGPTKKTWRGEVGDPWDHSPYEIKLSPRHSSSNAILVPAAWQVVQACWITNRSRPPAKWSSAWACLNNVLH
jgi:hypothetical protein